MVQKKAAQRVGRAGAAGRDRREEIIAFVSAEAWQAWLARHHASERAVWLKMAKKASGIPTVAQDEAIERALCYGWIDGHRKPLDDRYFLQRFTPRRPGSRWSQVNRERAETLIESGAMRAAGLAQIDRAKADGRWAAAYPRQRGLAVPVDLQSALDRNKKAAAFFATLDSRNRYSVLYRISDAKRPETRNKRIKSFVSMLARREKIYP